MISFLTKVIVKEYRTIIYCSMILFVIVLIEVKPISDHIIVSQANIYVGPYHTFVPLATCGINYD